MTSPFEPGVSPWTGPALNEAIIRQAETNLGLRLPQAYLDLMHLRNGGVLKDGCFPRCFRTSWAADHC